MFDRLRESGLVSSRGLGGVLVSVGAVMFLVVFFIALPVLTDPVGTYDEWFPEGDEEPVAAEPVDEEPEFEAPRARFGVVAEARAVEPESTAEDVEVEEGEETAVEYVAMFDDRSEAPDGQIVEWSWDLGDGATENRQFFEHRYDSPGTYPVRLEITDERGQTSVAEGEVEVPEEGRIAGEIESGEEFDLSGIEAAVEDAVATLEVSIDDTLASVASAARSAAVVVLFALAAIATTVVAWRITRSGIMLLSPQDRLKLKVRSADMHVDLGGSTFQEAAGEMRAEESELVDA